LFEFEKRSEEHGPTERRKDLKRERKRREKNEKS
jgi:hypothetical protein